MAKHSLQRVKFDLTQDELLADRTELRDVFHPYEDSPQPTPRVRCYSVDEILAEKTRALYERNGRARDVYDVVHLSREFKDAVNTTRAADIARRKFAYKGLEPPTVAAILARVDDATLTAAWDQQLRHQLPHLPPVATFLADLHDALAWWLEPERPLAELPPIATSPTEQVVARARFPTSAAPAALASYGAPPSALRDPLDWLRYSARNRLCARVVYEGVERLIEPYSLRRPATGNLLLYVYEIDRGDRPTRRVKALKVAEIGAVHITDRPFTPRFRVEL
jgi:hypothetical protein